MRRYGLILLCALLLLGLTACGGTPQDSTTTTTTTSSTAKTIATKPTQLLAEGYCVADPSMFVRSAPHLFAETVGGLAYGDKVQILSRSGDWFCIAFGDGTGYVSAQYIRAELPQE